MTALAPTLTAADLVETVVGTRGQIIAAVTPDQRFALQWDETGWSIIRIADEVWLAYNPTLEYALHGISSGWADHEMNLMKARRAAS